MCGEIRTNFKKEKEVDTMGKMEVNIYGLNENYYVDENKIVKYETSNGDIYEEAYQLDDGRWIAFGDGVNSWVMIG